MELVYNKSTKSFSDSLENRTFSLKDRVKYMRKPIKLRLRALIINYKRYYALNPEDAPLLRKMLTSDLANLMVEAAPLLAESNNINALLGVSALPVRVNKEALNLQKAYRKALTGAPSTYNKFINAYSNFVTEIVNGIIS